MEARNARTALVIPVPAAEAVTGTPWVTLVDPFLSLAQIDEGVLDELEEFFAGVTSFAFALGEPARFPDGPSYLPPQPVAAFRRIAAELRRAFPEVVTASPAFDANVAHLIVPDGVSSAPIETHAREARLLLKDGQDRVLAAFPFGTSAA